QPERARSTSRTAAGTRSCRRAPAAARLASRPSGPRGVPPSAGPHTRLLGWFSAAAVAVAITIMIGISAAGPATGPRWSVRERLPLVRRGQRHVSPRVRGQHPDVPLYVAEQQVGEIHA